jgi:hypothetical protein
VACSQGGFAGEFIPGFAGTALLIASGVLAVAAVLIIVFARGRLSYQPDRPVRAADTPTLYRSGIV